MNNPGSSEALAIESFCYSTQQDNCAIILCINRGYWPHAAVVIRSILVNSKHHPVPIFIIYDYPDQDWISRITRMGQLSHSQIELLNFDSSVVADFKVFGRLSLATYYRLFAPRMLPQYTKLLYLDADLVVAGDLSQLLQIDLNSYPIAARPVPVVESTLINKRLQRELSLPYFNAGVLLINTKLWEDLSCTENIIEIILNESDRLCYADQCALNLFFGDNYKSLSLEWNITRRFFESNHDSKAYSEIEAANVSEALSRPKVIHYTGDYKPWHVQCKHPLRQLYWKHRSFFHPYPYATVMRVYQLCYSSKSLIEVSLVRLQSVVCSFVRKVRARIAV